MFLTISQYSQENSKAFLTFARGIKMENYQKENQKNIFRQCEKMSEYFILSDDTVLSEKLNCVLLHITFYVFGLRLTREKLINVWLKFEMLRRVTKPKHISILPMITVFFYLDCDVNLGLGNYKLPDSSITTSSLYNSQYNTSKIRLDRKDGAHYRRQKKVGWKLICSR